MSCSRRPGDQKFRLGLLRLRIAWRQWEHGKGWGRSTAAQGRDKGDLKVLKKRLGLRRSGFSKMDSMCSFGSQFPHHTVRVLSQVV